MRDEAERQRQPLGALLVFADATESFDKRRMFWRARPGLNDPQYRG